MDPAGIIARPGGPPGHPERGGPALVLHAGELVHLGVVEGRPGRDQPLAVGGIEAEGSHLRWEVIGGEAVDVFLLFGQGVPLAVGVLGAVLLRRLRIARHLGFPNSVVGPGLPDLVNAPGDRVEPCGEDRLGPAGEAEIGQKADPGEQWSIFLHHLPDATVPRGIEEGTDDGSILNPFGKKQGVG